MAPLVLDAKPFHKRADALMRAWKASPQEFGSADVLLFIMGSADDDIINTKATLLHTWLLGYEFPDTLLMVTKDKWVFMTTSKKGLDFAWLGHIVDLPHTYLRLGTILEGLRKGANGEVTLEILKRTKDPAHNKDLFAQVLKNIKPDARVGIFAKDRFQGKIIDEWKEARKTATFVEVDVSSGVQIAMAVKDEEELRIVRTACKLSDAVMTRVFVPEMTTIMDEERKVKHSALASKLENYVAEPHLQSKLKVTGDIAWEQVEWCYQPIIQSGGKYDLRPSATTNSENMHEGIIVCSIGVRYKSYCSNVARTYLMNPVKSQEDNYRFLLKLQEHVLQSIKDGVKCNEVYNNALSYIESNRPDLKDNFLKNVGFGIGLDYRESQYVLSAKNEAELKSGMILNVLIGFQNLEKPGGSDARSKTYIANVNQPLTLYALQLGDIVRVTDGAPTLLTESKKAENDVSFEFKDEDEEPVEKVEVKKERANGNGKAPPAPQGRRTALDKKLRDESERLSNEQRRREHQKMLARQKQEEGLKRFSNGTGGGPSTEKAAFKKYESYKKEALLPRNVGDMQIIVDRRNDSIILPIYGMAVPFHVSCLKNVTKQDEQDHVYLRFNFITPGQSTGKKEPALPYEDPNATFVRALSFRSTDSFRFNEIYKEINDLKKDLTKREAERKEMADLVEQDKLVEIKGRRPIRLQEVFMRPQLESKRASGDLEIHSNGLRYQSQRSDQRVDILFSNIKHLFFQPCDSELIVILHIHLRNPIMIGKKKTKDVQLYRDVTDATFDETVSRGRRQALYGDEDELAQEQEERKRRQQLNREFQQFADKIKDASRNEVDVDVPFRDLGFMGVPSRQLVLLQPTTDCLVHLTDVPFLVITLSEVEIAHLERVQFGLKNFDLVFVFKDFTRNPVHINTIPVKQLDHIKDWLDSVDIPFSEGPVNLSWNTIMKTINEDPAAFFANDGWSFLQPGSDGESSEEDVSEYEMSESEFGGSESDSEDDYSSDSGASESASDFSGESDASGEDWDELERRAAKTDQKVRDREGGGPKKRRDDSDDDRPSKKSKSRR
ncbi:FACT complex subunit spt16 [Borealophlyctis nickersoniae]|nr:FACT complex subunit spt16 [Borealophlyctis nickersoniae]